MTKPTFDGWHDGSGCDNDACDGGRSGDPTVHHVEVIDRMYPSKGHDGCPFDWPPPDGVTHMCDACGFCYWGTTDAFDRRMEADYQRFQRRVERSAARHGVIVEKGHDPVCGDAFDDEGWGRVLSEMTPAKALCVALTRMPSDVPLEDIAVFADNHVRGIGREYVESKLADVVDRRADEWGFPSLAEYDAFTTTASDFM